MTDAELSAAMVVHPKGPKPIREEQPHPGWRDGAYEHGGIRWNLHQKCDPVTGKWDKGVWTIQFADPATAGVLLGMLPSTGEFATIYYGLNDGGVLVASVRIFGKDEYKGATLGEAVARALLACWGPV